MGGGREEVLGGVESEGRGITWGGDKWLFAVSGANLTKITPKICLILQL